MKKTKRIGFTVIEVTLVLAVAGLIFAIIFTTLPMMQRSARDTQRREDIMSLITSIKKYQENNRGSLPTGGDVNGASYGEGIYDSAGETTWQGFYRDYLKSSFKDPYGEYYSLRIVTCSVNATDAECPETSGLIDETFPYAYNGMDYTILVVQEARCSGTKAIKSSNPRNVAAIYKLEGPEAFCQDM